MDRTELLNQFDLTGRTAIITGGSRGIGRAIAGGFAALGVNVVIASRIDIVVNNAANALAQPLGGITPEAWEKSFSTNLRGPVFLVQEALPHLRASAHPAIINMVTAGIYTGGGWMSMYLAAKSAMAFMTRSMAQELAADNIRVNAIAPGTVATDMVRNNPEEVQQAMVDAQLIKRMAHPDEMVPAAAFLASDASSFMTGQVMVLDGGMTHH